MQTTFLRGLLLAAALLSSLVVQAQDYPAKPIRIIVPFQPGGGSDTLARLLAEKLHAKWGQPVVVENRAGAGGNLGAELVAKAAPDGYTLLISSPGPVVINKSLYGKLPHDPDTLVPVSVIATNYGVLVVHPKTGAKNVQQLIANAKANPDRLNYASAGSGTTPHLATELLKSMAGIQLVHVPYKGGGPAFAGLLGGQVDMMFVDIFTALPHIRAGKLQALALGGGKRNALLPDVPTMSEVIPGFDYMVWQGMVAPAGTPSAVADKLSAAIAEAVRRPEVIKQLMDVGLEPVGGTPSELAQVMRQDRERWGAVVRATGAKAD
jgi:tripartite-type tricarboxylate transporter receptor subunit TctC